MTKITDSKKKSNLTPHKCGPKFLFTPDELSKKIDKYFDTTPTEDITITGLCIYLNINKDTFYEYNKKPEFKNITEMARLKVEHAYELSLRHYGRAGDIFALKNFGWRDKQELAVGAGDFGSSLDKFVDKLGDKNE